MTPLVHYSCKPLTTLRSVKHQTIGVKPEGLWVSIHGTDDWEDWCRSEGFRLDRLACGTEVLLKKTATLLHIASVSEIDDFDNAFGEPLCETIPHYRVINWGRVAKLYQGIVIAPYLWSRRLGDGCRWYYGWDCASGCIWDADAVAELRPFAGASPTESEAP